MTQPKKQNDGSQKKAEYHPPTLTEYGPMTSLTAAGSAGEPEGAVIGGGNDPNRRV